LAGAIPIPSGACRRSNPAGASRLPLFFSCPKLRDRTTASKGYAGRATRAGTFTADYQSPDQSESTTMPMKVLVLGLKERSRGSRVRFTHCPYGRPSLRVSGKPPTPLYNARKGRSERRSTHGRFAGMEAPRPALVFWHSRNSALPRFLKSEDGPTAVEYAVMLALIIVVCLVAITAVGSQASTTFSNVAASLGGAS
jgi:pilus assembly protein Flp/PilA